MGEAMDTNRIAGKGPRPGAQDRPIWISAGEASGDMHGAALMRGFAAKAAEMSGESGKLNAPRRFTGMGGPAMEAEGFAAEFDSHEISLVGLTEVFGHLPRIVGLLRRVYARLKSVRPAAVILIDAPDFNFLVARMARRLGIPAYYYISPQVWAWRKGRVRFLRDYTRKVLCILPFEEEFYRAHGARAEYVGHPLLDEIPMAELDSLEPEAGRVGILPGSRRREVATLLPRFVQAARMLQAQDPELRFTLVRAPGMDMALLREHLPDTLSVEIVEPEERYRYMRRCRLLLAASGTVTLEAALMGVPTVVAYTVSPVTYALGRLLVDVPFISLPNLIMGRQVFPELIQGQASPERIAAQARLWLTSESAYAATRQDLAGLRHKFGESGAADRAARTILEDLQRLGR